MLLSSFLLFFLCGSTVKSQTTMLGFTTIKMSTVAVEENVPPLQLVATPNYPVAAGQRVTLHCSAVTMPDSATWSWQRLQNQTWQAAGIGRDLTLTEPRQSGTYRCSIKSQFSQGHAVYIISMHSTVKENLGLAAFVLSLVALIINFAILFWLGWQRYGATQTTSNTAAKEFPGPEKAPKGGLPQTGSDGDTYMNYTNTQTGKVYTDLDPTNMTEDTMYSSLS